VQLSKFQVQSGDHGEINVNDTIVNECGTVGEMRTSWGNQSTLRNPVPVSLCPPQIPHDMTWDGTQVAMMRSQ
jgi:hypothetical protein